MKNLILNIKKHPIAYIVTFIIGLLLGLVPVITLYFVENRSLHGAYNGAGYAFLGILFFGALMWLANMGTYDIMTYGFSQMFTSMFSKNPNKYNDFVSYKEEKNKKRDFAPRYYVAFLFAAVVYAILTLVLYLCYTL